jgi:hypothetical protein
MGNKGNKGGSLETVREMLCFCFPWLMVAVGKRKEKRQKKKKRKKRESSTLYHSQMGWYLSTWLSALKNAYYLYPSLLILRSYNAGLELNLAPPFSVLAREREREK